MQNSQEPPEADRRRASSEANQRTITIALQELDHFHKYVEDVAAYAKKSYAINQDAAYKDTRNYTKDVLCAVAEHVHVVAANIVDFLGQQSQEMSRLERNVSALKAKRKVREHARSASRDEDSVAKFCWNPSRLKVFQLKGGDLPAILKRGVQETPLTLASVINLPPLSRPSAVCNELNEDYTLPTAGERGSRFGLNGADKATVEEDEEVKDNGSASPLASEAKENPLDDGDDEEDQNAEASI